MSKRRKSPPVVSFEDTEIHTWFERDRASVELRNSETQDSIVEWWDEDVNMAVEDGFLDPRDWHGSAYEYAVEHGFVREPKTNPMPEPFDPEMEHETLRRHFPYRVKADMAPTPDQTLRELAHAHVVFLGYKRACGSRWARVKNEKGEEFLIRPWLLGEI